MAFEVNLAVKGDVTIGIWFTDHFAEVRDGYLVWERLGGVGGREAETALSSCGPAFSICPLDSELACLVLLGVLQWDPPALAYAFHTAFVDCADGGVVRATGGLVCLACWAACPARLPCRSGASKGACATCVLLHSWATGMATALLLPPAEPASLPKSLFPSCLPACLPAARKLDVPGSSAAAVAAAEREGFFIDLIVEDSSQQQLPPGIM